MEILFDIDNLSKELSNLEEKTSDASFWNDSKNTASVLSKIKILKNKVTKYKELTEEVDTLLEMLELIKEDFDEQLANELIKNVNKLEKNAEKLEIETLLSGKYDSNNAIVTIHPGARRN